MRRTKIRFALWSVVAAAILTMAAVAFAGNPHFVGSPLITKSGGNIEASGKAAGIGKGDVVYVQLEAQVQYQCINPGGHEVEPHSGTASGISDPDIADRNGQYHYDVSASLAGGCPNPNWTINVTSASGTLSLFVNGQPADSTSF